MQIFRKELLLKLTEGTDIDDEDLQLALNTWVKDCDGKEVVNGEIHIECEHGILTYLIDEEWCEEV